MWAFKEREKKIFKKMFPSEYFGRTVQCPNGGEVTVEELFKRGLISASEVHALYKSLPEDVEFHKFIDCLRPRKNQESETMTEDQKKAKQAYRQRIQKLKEKQANKEYAEMTKSIDRARDQPLLQNFGQELRAANRQMIAVANTLITVGGAFAFGFWGIHFAYPHLRLDIAERMLLGLVFGTIVFFADLYFLVKGMDQDGKLI